MLIKPLQKCEEIVAGDKVIIREILHPVKESLKLRYSLAHGTIRPGESSQRHKLVNSEVYYILDGEGIMFIDNESEKVYPNQTIYVPPHAVQFIRNAGHRDLQFLCIVDPAWRPEDEELV
ncbi:MAG: cupin domain-containing protein [Candidatus Loosdrechtia sp.]|uniref:cupin domain-containing protein n=1 Tax=Candidatus Loosdrechtia sp. TaxID=3101272 RepID=UPI003A726A41|nr:MAG: cupin domain-containing protein [Candidatus Jettenia sp. AMX2]